MLIIEHARISRAGRGPGDRHVAARDDPELRGRSDADDRRSRRRVRLPRARPAGRCPAGPADAPRGEPRRLGPAHRRRPGTQPPRDRRRLPRRRRLHRTRAHLGRGDGRRRRRRDPGARPRPRGHVRPVDGRDGRPGRRRPGASADRPAHPRECGPRRRARADRHDRRHGQDRAARRAHRQRSEGAAVLHPHHRGEARRPHLPHAAQGTHDRTRQAGRSGRVSGPAGRRTPVGYAGARRPDGVHRTRLHRPRRQRPDGSTANAIALARRLPGAAVTVYPDSGHGVVFQYHREFVAGARDFLHR